MGRGRLSSIDLLPEEAADDVVWACQELYVHKRTIDDIFAEFSERLEAKGIEPVSRSAFHRKAVRLSAAQRRMRESRAMFEGLASEFTAEDVDQNTIVLGEFLKTLITELTEDQTGLKSPKDAMELARGYHAVVAAQKISTDRRQQLEVEFARKATKAVDAVGRAKGLTADTVESIKSLILGIKKPEKAE